MSTSREPPIVWAPSFELGIEDIDLQHRYFANLINRLAQDFAVITDAKLRLSLLAELNAYARFHFISEENLMARHGYPEADAHRALHLKLVDELSARETQMIMKNAPADAQAVLDFLVQWFLGHTTHEDRVFANYLRDAGQRPTD